MCLLNHTNFLFIVFVIQVICDCSSLKFTSGNSRKLQENKVLRKVNENFFDNSTKQRDKTNSDIVYKRAYSLTQDPHVKREERISQNNLKMIIVSWKTKKTNKTAKRTTFAHERNIRHFTFVAQDKTWSTTPSYIEFYYSDEKADKNSIQNVSFIGFDKLKSDKSIKESSKFKRSTKPTSPLLFSFSLHGPYIRKVLANPRTSNILQNFDESLLYPHVETIYKSNAKYPFRLKYKVSSSELITTKTGITESNQKTTVKISLNASKEASMKNISEQPTVLKKNISFEMPTPISTILPESISTILPTTISSILRTTISTIPYDRIKFFEMYDKDTIPPEDESSETSERENDINISSKYSTEGNNSHVNRRHCKNPQRKQEENHILDSAKVRGKSDSTVESPIRDNNALESFRSATIGKYTPLEDKDAHPKAFNEFSNSGFITVKIANWSRYPFASVYVYKPTQTHCDAGAISSHWLVAAGSCLSRHRLIPTLDERSAFVAYCGECWQQTERIAYVMRSVVHPKFSPRNRVKRMLYNIGLIQVSSSMTSCPGWSPITLMSHQFTADFAGSTASAVGWGLDRYGTKYSSERLPQLPLTVYDSLIFSGTCPGSTTFSAARKDGGADNIYCLLLPPYAGEESDPIHGGLLLVGEKLVALYLQEERRVWGAQSAQYTGLWRLLPWVMATARESDEDATLLNF